MRCAGGWRQQAEDWGPAATGAVRAAVARAGRECGGGCGGGRRSSNAEVNASPGCNLFCIGVMRGTKLSVLGNYVAILRVLQLEKCHR